LAQLHERLDYLGVPVERVNVIVRLGEDHRLKFLLKLCQAGVEIGGVLFVVELPDCLLEKAPESLLLRGLGPHCEQFVKKQFADVVVRALHSVQDETLNRFKVGGKYRPVPHFLNLFKDILSNYIFVCLRKVRRLALGELGKTLVDKLPALCNLLWVSYNILSYKA